MGSRRTPWRGRRRPGGLTPCPARHHRCHLQGQDGWWSPTSARISSPCRSLSARVMGESWETAQPARRSGGELPPGKFGGRTGKLRLGETWWWWWWARWGRESGGKRGPPWPPCGGLGGERKPSSGIGGLWTPDFTF